MRILRTIILTLIMIIATANVSPIAANAAGGVSEIPSEPRSTSLVETPTKWKKVTFKIGPSISYWKKVAQCETGNNWKNGGYYSGGLGMARSTWVGYGGLQFAKHPYQATMLEQIVVANRVAVLGWQTNEFRTLDDRLNNKPFYRPAVGFKGWGCIKNHTYLQAKAATHRYTKLPVGDQFYCPQFEPIFKKYSLPVKVFSYIAWRESRCNPTATNATWANGQITWTLNKDGSYDSGLLQINSCWFKTLKQETGYDPQDLLKPEVNAIMASWIVHFSSGRLQNWSIKSNPV